MGEMVLLYFIEVFFISIKKEELTEAFSQTEAYSQLFMELATDADAAAKFINGITPKDIDTSKIDRPDLGIVPKE